MAKKYQIHSAQKVDDEGIRDLWHYCFEKRDEAFHQWFFMNEEKYSHKNVLGAYEQESIKACLHMMPYSITLRGNIVPVSYIIGVSALPESRGNSIGRALLTEALREMKSKQHYVSLLMPFKAGFYYPFQWEMCYWQQYYKIPLESFKSSIKAKWETITAVKQDCSEHLSYLADIYKTFTDGLHGYVCRTAKEWRAMLGENKAGGGYAYMLADEQGKYDAYLLYILREETFIVVDWGYDNAAAQARLVSFIKSHFSQVKYVEIPTKVNDLLRYVLTDVKDALFIKPFMSARIVDVKGCLESLKYEDGEEFEFTIKISDEMAKWNNKAFAIKICNGKAEVEVLHDETTSCIIECSIGALTQMVFGALDAEDLFKLGRIKCDNNAIISKLQCVFKQQNNYCNEYF